MAETKAVKSKTNWIIGLALAVAGAVSGYVGANSCEKQPAEEAPAVEAPVEAPAE